jgi:hypothetical protein
MHGSFVLGFDGTRWSIQVDILSYKFITNSEKYF